MPGSMMLPGNKNHTIPSIGLKSEIQMDEKHNQWQTDSVADQCRWVLDIGYQNEDCSLKTFDLALLGGRKTSSNQNQEGAVAALCYV
jgi:hypothetical protein